MTKTALVVFDMAGTTISDQGKVGETFMEACREYNIEVPFEAVKKVMGFRKKDAIRILLNDYNTLHRDNADELVEKIHDLFIRKMIAFYEQDPSLSPLPYAEETFSLLKQQGVKIALNTGFTRSIADAILKRLHWQEGATVDMVIASDEVPQGRPYPHMIQTIMERLNITGSAAVAKVGDTGVDVEEGRNAGCGKVISITTGAYTRAQLEAYQPDNIIDSLADLPSLIQ